MIRSGVRTRLILLGAPVVLATAVLQSQDGGYDITEWAALAMLFVGLLAVAGLAGLLSGPASRTIALSLVLLGAYTLVNFLSILWAEVEGDAWDGANRTLLYLLVYSLAVLVPWRGETVIVLLGSAAVLTAALGFGSLLASALVADPDPYFIAGRFSSPMGYQNGNCAFFLMGLFAALPLAGRPELPPLARGVLLASAGVLLELALLTQSRASLAAAPVTLFVLFLLVPGRLRTLAAVLPVAVAGVLSHGVLLDVFTAVRTGDDDPGALDTAAVAVGATACLLALIGVLTAYADGRLTISDRFARRATVAARAAFVGCALVLVAVAATRIDHPVRRVQDAWTSFKKVEEPGSAREVGSTNFGSGLGGNRYDLWRVALAEFRDHPVVGIGAENFAVDYLRERRTYEEVLHPHSLVLRALVQTGIVGAALLAGAFAAAAGAAVSAVRRGGVDAVASGTGLTVFAYWLVHGSVDWFWELPGIGVPAFVALGLSASLGRRMATPRPPRVAQRTLATIVVAAGLLGAVASLAPSWLSAKETEAAGIRWRADAGEAFARLDRARRLNPLSEKPDLFAAVIAGKLGDTGRMRAHLGRAIDRKPSSWYAHFELGVLDGVEGNRTAALRELRVAERLNPLEPAIDEAVDRVTDGRRLRLEDYDRLFLERARAVGR